MSELKVLTGGAKRMWLREHRAEVVDFYEKEGKEATKKRYRLTHDTLGSLLKGERKPFGCEFTRYDRLELKVNMTQANIEDLRAEVSELKEMFATFQESVAEQLKRGFLLPLIRAVIRLDQGLELEPKPDPLNLTNMVTRCNLK